MATAAAAASTSSPRALTSMPAILYGAAWKAERTADLVRTAFKAGFRGVDTAAQRKHYREDLVGEGIERAMDERGLQREEVWIQTKFTPISGQDLNGPVPYDIDAPVRQQIRSSFLSSLRNLNRGPRWDWEAVATAFKGKGKSEAAAAGEAATRPQERAPSLPWIDSYLLHSPLSTLQETVEAWREMEDLVLEGWIRGGIGFSNVYDPRIFNALVTSATRVRPTILQNRWHSTTGHDVSLLSSLSPVLSPNDFAPTASDPAPRGITYQGFWLLTGNPRFLESTPVLDAAVDLGMTPEQVIYRFVAQGFGIPGIHTAVLCGSTTERHMEEAVQAVTDSKKALGQRHEEAIRRVVYGE